MPVTAGSSVEVRCRFDGGWVTGFEVAAVDVGQTDEGRSYRVRRSSDGTVLPVPFHEAELREVARY